MTKLESLQAQHLIQTKMLKMQQSLEILILENPSMAVSPEVASLINQFDAATNAIAARIQALINKPTVSLSPEDVQAFNTEIANLQALGQDPSQPVPPAV